MKDLSKARNKLSKIEGEIKDINNQLLYLECIANSLDSAFGVSSATKASFVVMVEQLKEKLSKLNKDEITYIEKVTDLDRIKSFMEF